MASATLELLEFIRLQNLKVLANLSVEGVGRWMFTPGCKKTPGC